MKLELDTREGLARALRRLCQHHLDTNNWVAWLNLRISMREKGFL